MKLGIRIEPEDNPDGISLDFEVPIPQKHINVIKESGKLISAVKDAIQNIKGELREDKE